jgi:hypothetical protein
VLASNLSRRPASVVSAMDGLAGRGGGDFRLKTGEGYFGGGVLDAVDRTGVGGAGGIV